MPPVQKGDYILVTGASGFIGCHTAREFLREGFRVRATVRSTSKGEYLEKLFKGEGRFDYVIVEDITQDGGFDEAVKGVDAVAHTASPFYTTGVKDPQELIQPAVKGTTGIMKSIQKSNPKCKRVVITSSIAAILSTHSRKAPILYTEKDWNQDSVKQVEEKGANADGTDSYRASKTLAEQAMWKFIEEEKPTWEGVTINPPLVLGEVIHQCDKPEDLNTSVAGFYAWARGQKKDSDLPGQLGNWINVHDVALAHVRALTVGEAAGNRFITANGPFTGQDYCDIIHKHFPDLPNVPIGNPYTHDEICKTMSVFDGAKATKVLGVKYETLEDTVVEMGKCLRRRFDF
ncbi:MAG: methylglyoxal reductase (NADPH-dependent) gre2 [Tremellales sp. Tagirdzhanova-0007]|nr:MAG: methylglyoxal reductase (NADPH-dependent) gre2 [Tremellales sp. Tagirdzhanova-0007]